MLCVTTNLNLDQMYIYQIVDYKSKNMTKQISQTETFYNEKIQTFMLILVTTITGLIDFKICHYLRQLFYTFNLRYLLFIISIIN